MEKCNLSFSLVCAVSSKCRYFHVQTIDYYIIVVESSKALTNPCQGRAHVSDNALMIY